MQKISDFATLMSYDSSEVVDKIKEKLQIFSTDDSSLTRLLRKVQPIYKVYSIYEWKGDTNR